MVWLTILRTMKCLYSQCVCVRVRVHVSRQLKHACSWTLRLGVSERLCVPVLLVWSHYVRRCCSEGGRVGREVCGLQTGGWQKGACFCRTLFVPVHRPRSLPPALISFLLFLCQFFLFYLFQAAVSFSFTLPDLHAYSIAVSSFSLPIPPFSHSSVPSGVSSSLPSPMFFCVFLAHSPTILLISVVVLRSRNPTNIRYLAQTCPLFSELGDHLHTTDFLT